MVGCIYGEYNMEIFDSWLVNRYIAHRGLHDEQFAENSLSAFENAINNGYAIEFDVQSIGDGTPVIFHDDTLKRVTGMDGYTRNITSKDNLKKYKLNNTKDTIPTLKQVLKFVDGRTPLLIEIKNTGKVGQLEEAVWEELKKYKGEYAIQSFNPYVLEWFKQNAPEVIRGQLSCKFKGEDMGFFKKLILRKMCLNKKVSEPNFISYKFDEIPRVCSTKYKNLPLIVWTVASQQDYMTIIKKCDNIIFEGFTPKI